MPPDKRPTSPVTGLSTTFLVPNIHCATCTDFINNLLLHLDPPPSSVTTTMVNHTVTVEHSPEFDPRMAARALASSGYEVDSVIPSSRLQQVTEAAGPSDDNCPVPWLNNLENMWSKGSDGPEEETTRLEHAKNCRHCQESTSGELVPADDSEKDTAETASPDGKAASFVVVGSSEPPQAYQAVLEISGMSCSSCVGKITEALEAKPWISSASVGLLTHTATVGFYGKEHAGELARIRSDPGRADSSLWRRCAFGHVASVAVGGRHDVQLLRRDDNQGGGEASLDEVRRRQSHHHQRHGGIRGEG